MELALRDSEFVKQPLGTAHTIDFGLVFCRKWVSFKPQITRNTKSSMSLRPQENTPHTASSASSHKLTSSSAFLVLVLDSTMHIHHRRVTRSQRLPGQTEMCSPGSSPSEAKVNVSCTTASLHIGETRSAPFSGTQASVERVIV